MCRACTSPTRSSKRLEGRSRIRKAEGKRICIDIINEVKEIEGVSGIHVMAYRQEEFVAEIVHESGVLKGRGPGPRNPHRWTNMVAARMEEILEEPKARCRMKWPGDRQATLTRRTNPVACIRFAKSYNHINNSLCLHCKDRT
jgi:hypothetical protein